MLQQFLYINIACIIVSFLPAAITNKSSNKPMLNLACWHFFATAIMLLIILSSHITLPDNLWVINTVTLYWIITLSSIIICFNLYASRQKNIANKYLHIQSAIASSSILLIHFIAWVIYLVTYEWLIRGIVLYSGIQLFGIPYAILLNTLLYFTMHLQKGWREATGSIPLGIIFCFGVLQTQSIYTAIIPHIIMALSFESFVLIRNKISTLKNK